MIVSNHIMLQATRLDDDGEGAILISSGVLPEERAKEFRALTDITILSDMKVIQEPTPQENVFIYAVNNVAQRGVDISQINPRVKQILCQNKSQASCCYDCCRSAIVMTDRQSGELLYSSAGQVIITANWQIVGDAP